MPASAKKVASKTKAASSYTYTGCWTCRKRHVKCSEERPECNRCKKAGFECAGYDFKFAGSGSLRTFRRPVAPGSSSLQQPALSSAQVTGYLEELDAVANSTQKGPFSVLSFGPAEASTDTSEELRDTIIPFSNLERLHDNFNPDIASSPGDSGYQSSLGAHNEDNVKTIPRSHPDSPPMVMEPHLISVSMRQSELFEHWTTFVCNNLSPLSASSANPFRYVYPSLALEGIMTSADTAGPRLAVWHGICGTAAWSLSKLKPENNSYHALSVYHDQLALQYIQQNIVHPDGLIDAAIPAAIMTCLTGDTISGRLDAWGRHLKGGFGCLLAVLARQKSSSTTSVLCEQYLLAASLANFGSPLELRTLQKGIYSDYSYMEECHCITRPMINILVATNLLAKSQKRTDPTQIEKIRRILVQSAPKSQDNLTRYHLAFVWYYAISIHFTRNLVISSGTQQFALRAVEHLELAKDSDDSGTCGRIIMWPLLTIGLECKTPELRARLFEWCTSQLRGRQQVSNIDTFLALLRETWTPKPLEGLLPIRENDIGECGKVAMARSSKLT